MPALPVAGDSGQGGTVSPAGPPALPVAADVGFQAVWLAFVFTPVGMSLPTVSAGSRTPHLRTGGASQ